MTQHGIERSFQGLNMNDSPGTQKKIPPAVAPKPSKVLNTSPKPFKAGITYRSEINLWVNVTETLSSKCCTIKRH